MRILNHAVWDAYFKLKPGMMANDKKCYAGIWNGACRQAARAALAALRHGAPRSEAPAPRLQIRARARLCLHCVATVSRTPRWPTHPEKPEGHDSNAAQAKAWLCFDSKEFRARFPRELREMMVQLPKSVLTHLSKRDRAFYDKVVKRCVRRCTCP